jgi:hypothetical protein
MSPTVLAATWNDGLFIVTPDSVHREFADTPVRGLSVDEHGDVLAIVAGHSVRRRASDGRWNTIAASEHELSCTVAVGNTIYVGTDDARIFRLDNGGELQPLRGLDSIDGRDGWYAGTVTIDGQELGPPLGIRSISSTASGALLASVHVGGIPKSTDGGKTWKPTIEVDFDVHEVRAHPADPNIVIAAAAIGLCISRDAGATWTVEREGLHASYCSAVAFAGNDVLVAASADHFAAQGAIYKRALDEDGRLERVCVNGLEWVEGIADTACIAADAETLAIADRVNLYVSRDAGRTWPIRADGVRGANSLVIV